MTAGHFFTLLARVRKDTLKVEAHACNTVGVFSMSLLIRVFPRACPKQREANLGG